MTARLPESWLSSDCPPALPLACKTLCLLCPALCPRKGLLGAAVAAWAWPIEGTRMRRQGGRLLLFCFSLPGCCVWGMAASRWPAALEGWTLFHGSSSWQALVMPPAPSSLGLGC